MNKGKDYLKIRKEEMMINKRLGQDMKFKIAYATIMNEKGGRDNYRIDVISYDPGEDTKILYNEVVDYIDKDLCLDINTKEGKNLKDTVGNFYNHPMLRVSKDDLNTYKLTLLFYMKDKNSASIREVSLFRKHIKLIKNTKITDEVKKRIHGAVKILFTEAFGAKKRNEMRRD